MRPECGFFYKSWEHEKGKNYYLSKWFHEVRDEKARGERSSLYLHGARSNHVAQRIHAMYPEIKLIFCLRNPTERAYANYRFTALCGFESLSFRDALRQEEKRKRSMVSWMKEIQPFLYRERGLYFQQIEEFLKYFPREQMLFINSRELAVRTKEVLQRAYRFLDVGDDYQGEPLADFSSPNVRSLAMQRMLRRVFGAKLDDLTEGFRREENPDLLGRIVGLNLTGSKLPLDAGLRAELNEFYASSNRQLAELLEWDLSDWV